MNTQQSKNCIFRSWQMRCDEPAIKACMINRIVLAIWAVHWLENVSPDLELDNVVILQELFRSCTPLGCPYETLRPCVCNEVAKKSTDYLLHLVFRLYRLEAFLAVPYCSFRWHVCRVFMNNFSSITRLQCINYTTGNQYRSHRSQFGKRRSESNKESEALP